MSAALRSRYKAVWHGTLGLAIMPFPANGNQLTETKNVQARISSSSWGHGDTTGWTACSRLFFSISADRTGITIPAGDINSSDCNPSRFSSGVFAPVMGQTANMQ